MFPLNENQSCSLLYIQAYNMETENKKIEDIIGRIRVSSEISVLGEELREDILSELHHRMDVASRRTLWLKMVGVAAAVLLILGITNYVSFQEGYKQLNSQMVEMKNPLGLKSSLILSDGTKVTLNAGTTLSYPTAFVSDQRIVKVSGEAFFEVARDEKHPFIVKAENVNIRVLGTRFNVKAYEEENKIEVTLTEGRVGVGLDDQANQINIQAGQQVLFDKGKGLFSKRQVNLDYYTGWRDDLFYFNRVTFEEIAKQLERRFNVNVEITSDRLKQVVFTGDFVRGENLEQILRVMTADKRTGYTIHEEHVSIYVR